MVNLKAKVSDSMQVKQIKAEELTGNKSQFASKRRPASRPRIRVNVPIITESNRMRRLREENRRIVSSIKE